MNTQHTRGPWRSGSSSGGAMGTVVADEPIPEVKGSEQVSYYGGHMVAESIALKNIPIIAAAPAMLKALETMVLWHCKRDGKEDKPLALEFQPPEVQEAMLAIAAATGSTT